MSEGNSNQSKSPSEESSFPIPIPSNPSQSGTSSNLPNSPNHPNPDQSLSKPISSPSHDSSDFLNQDSNYSSFENLQKTKKLTKADLNSLKTSEKLAFRRIQFSKIPTSLKPKYEQEEVEISCSTLVKLLEIRDKYIFFDEFNLQHPLDFTIRGNKTFEVIEELKSDFLMSEFRSGVVSFKLLDSEVTTQVISVEEFFKDLDVLIRAMSEAVVKSFCRKRLKLLSSKFKLHELCNGERERLHQKLKFMRNFNNVTKVDNHIHLAGAMNQKHLQKFMKKKLLHNPSELVTLSPTGEPQTLHQVFENSGISSENLTVDILDMSADHSIFHRFDKFNLKFNPMGRPLLREIFLKTDNYLNGRYFAEITKELISKLEQEKNTKTEFRVSIYGRKIDEWLKLAIWFTSFNLTSKCVKWLIQVPRIFNHFHSSGQVLHFQDFLFNLFNPIVSATLHPESFPEISRFLLEIVGFDSVDDESKNEDIRSYLDFKSVTPENWKSNENPPYSYYCYYMFANIFNINQLRAARGLNTFAFRPHSGEAGSISHLAAAFLTSHGVNHGIELKNSPVLQYLFYLKQIGLSVSPLSNNKLFLKISHNPFLKFFQRGLNVALSTDAPLVFHFTREGLVEEYSVAAQALELNDVDLCEIARNSVIQSGFEFRDKCKWLGKDFIEGGPESNEFCCSGLASVRYAYRYETFIQEVEYIERHSGRNVD